MTHELTFNELVAESQYLLKLQRGKITEIPRLVTARCLRQQARRNVFVSGGTNLYEPYTIL